MGDFDKNQTSNADAEKKKLILVGVLGAVLLGVVGFHFMKGNPGQASASVMSADAQPAALPAETPAQAQAALADDPTAALLRGSPNADAAFDTPPRNPFTMSATWHNSLVRVQSVVAPTQHIVQAPTAAVQSISLEGLKLTGIFREGSSLCAIVNGHLLTVGMTLDDVKVVDITHDHVTLQRADSPTGPKADLTIEPKLQ